VVPPAFAPERNRRGLEARYRAHPSPLRCHLTPAGATWPFRAGGVDRSRRRLPSTDRQLSVRQAASCVPALVHWSLRLLVCWPDYTVPLERVKRATLAGAGLSAARSRSWGHRQRAASQRRESVVGGFSVSRAIAHPLVRVEDPAPTFTAVAGRSPPGRGAQVCSALHTCIGAARQRSASGPSRPGGPHRPDVLREGFAARTGCRCAVWALSARARRAGVSYREAYVGKCPGAPPGPPWASSLIRASVLKGGGCEPSAGVDSRKV